ncbi:hypothetical protein [Streptomyces tendae]|uniref:hypothetical protein n=1 Tax=Streptomyces tendae TaxID=1932 RepID=UPI003662DE3C
MADTLGASTMTNPTDHPPTREHVQQLLDAAAAATGILPTIGQCQHLNVELRRLLAGLDQQLRHRQTGLTPRSRDWYAADRLLTDTGAVLAETMGLGLLSAATHVAALGRQAAAVLRWLEA